MPRTGVLLLGFGGPDSIEAVEPFMCNLMGRQPSSELVQRICGNYEAIGGKSPLVDIANDIAERLSARLSQLGHDVPTRVGMRYWDPYIADSLRELAEQGCARVVTVSLSPFESKVASGQYRLAIAEALDGIGALEVVEAPLVSELPAFADFLSESTTIALSGLASEHNALVAFTAHSLPMTDLEADDPYVAGLRRTASAIAERLGWGRGAEEAGEPLLPGFSAFGVVGPPQPWMLTYQSKGARPGAWLEPTLQDLIEAAKGTSVASLVVCPIGFVTDHMETLFDLDTIAAAQASDAGLAFVRAPVPNDDGLLVNALADAVAALV
jgi:protoporphyrin/coproporphyrin ferrochelatase